MMKMLQQNSVTVNAKPIVDLMKLISNDNSILKESNDDAVILSQYLDDVNP